MYALNLPGRSIPFWPFMDGKMTSSHFRTLIRSFRQRARIWKMRISLKTQRIASPPAKNHTFTGPAFRLFWKSMEPVREKTRDSQFLFPMSMNRKGQISKRTNRITTSAIAQASLDLPGLRSAFSLLQSGTTQKDVMRTRLSRQAGFLSALAHKNREEDSGISSGDETV